MTSSAPKETLISALAGVQRGKMPDDLQNILRAIHEGYADTRKTHIKSMNGTTAIRRYHLSLTDAGEGLLEAVE